MLTAAGSHLDERSLTVRWERRDRRHQFEYRSFPIGIEQQMIGLGCDLLRLLEDVLDRIVVGLARDELAGQDHYQVVACVALGGEGLGRQFVDIAKKAASVHVAREVQATFSMISGLSLVAELTSGDTSYASMASLA